ncbi:MAG: M23 family metallopeptidase [Candidatus Zambryskibacteria bacterium]|nr:M23 family metallopeptidase [Candidatus Zambryskibacteria bacterium]
MGSGKSAVNIGTSLILNIILLTSLSTPLPVQAGVISFFSNLFSSVEAETEEIQPNLQNMALLQAAISPNQNSLGTKEEITIVDGTSLLPDTQKLADTKTINEEQISIYVVRKGDTLPAIAKMFGVSDNTIRWGNNISGSTITVGQTLVILPISGVQHVVKSGDTLQSIAKLHKGDLDEILQYNNLSKNSKLAIGDIIVVPDGEVVPTSSGSSGNVRTSPAYPVYEGYYMRPIIGGIKTQGIHGYNGVDLASSYGTNILASAEGDVLISRNSGWNGGYGSYIVIKHPNGTQTLYAHMSATLVGAGTHVEQGQVIGKMGSTGKSTGSHVHFEIRGAKNPF